VSESSASTIEHRRLIHHSQNFATNDVAGNFSLTLVDVLDTFIVLNDRDGFEKAVKDVIEWVSFDVNTKPQVFETTIRILGGLLSGHLFANSTTRFHLPWYRGELLDMAHDLGTRLLPAFSTPTGIPYARVNRFGYSPSLNALMLSHRSIYVTVLLEEKPAKPVCRFFYHLNASNILLQAQQVLDLLC
jgi:hypothetical protein